MKKLLILIALITTSLVGFAQWSVPIYLPGDSIVKLLVTNASQLTNNALSNGPWDFSGATIFATPSVTRYVSPANTPNPALFLTATVAEIVDNDLTSIHYFSTANNQFNELGYKSNNSVTTYSNPRANWYYSLDQTSLFNDTYFGISTTNGVQMATISGKIKMQSLTVSTLTLPNGVSYANVLKVNFLDTNITASSGFGTDTTILDGNYYLVPNFKFPAASHGRLSNDGLVNYPVAAIMQPSLINGIEDYTEKYKFKVLNNICNDQINFELYLDPSNQKCNINIYALNGQLVDAESLTLNAGKNLNSINTSGLSSGAYLLNISIEDKNLNAYFIKE